MGKWVAINTR